MAYLNSRPRTPKICPVCGEDVPPKALACPECGADHQTGWKPGASDMDGLDLPDDDFDYEEFLQKEFDTNSTSSAKRLGIHPVWWVTGLVLLMIWILAIWHR